MIPKDSVLQWQTAVTAYFPSNQLLLSALHLCTDIQDFYISGLSLRGMFRISWIGWVWQQAAEYIRGAWKEALRYPITKYLQQKQEEMVTAIQIIWNDKQ